MKSKLFLPIFLFICAVFSIRVCQAAKIASGQQQTAAKGKSDVKTRDDLAKQLTDAMTEKFGHPVKFVSEGVNHQILIEEDPSIKPEFALSMFTNSEVGAYLASNEVLRFLETNGSLWWIGTPCLQGWCSYSRSPFNSKQEAIAALSSKSNDIVTTKAAQRADTAKYAQDTLRDGSHWAVAGEGNTTVVAYYTNYAAESQLEHAQGNSPQMRAIGSLKGLYELFCIGDDQDNVRCIRFFGEGSVLLGVSDFKPEERQSVVTAFAVAKTASNPSQPPSQ